MHGRVCSYFNKKKYGFVCSRDTILAERGAKSFPVVRVRVKRDPALRVSPR